MHDSIEEPDDFGEKEKVDLTIQTFQVFHQAWFRCSRRNQISTSVWDTMESVINTSTNYSL
ncbi:hypothetical protein CRE_15229 [Caenorhabditis remanei]|uniref:Uncharacterized protein n=1 Tax=Caenorhabditis remanei TaxID=31234 RepID=E3NU10_CAERE|nr:hypothetical protein CRE_15229 [Caenorhabditis remanei]